MHDPMTQAFRIPNPFARRYDWGKHWSDRPSLAIIWHVDPESDGSDDSCGWFGPKLTKEQRSSLQSMADDEAREPWFCAREAKRNPDAVESECLLRGAFLMVARVLRVRITWQEASLWSAEMIHNPSDNFRRSLCFLAGWHSNFAEDRRSDREQHAMELFCCLARYILRERRPWWKQPQWHIHPWKLQVPILQTFCRWAFSRCQKCGGRFTWGYSPISTWNGCGPGWFWNAERVWHEGCVESPMRDPAAKESA
jgi:hypothetical protein